MEIETKGLGAGSYPEPKEEKEKHIQAHIVISFDLEYNIPENWDKETIVEYIKEKEGFELTVYEDENQLNNHSQNIVILDYNKKKSSYKFTYKEKEIVEYNTSNTFPFMTTQLSSEISSDVFNYKYDDKGIEGKGKTKERMGRCCRCHRVFPRRLLTINRYFYKENRK